MKLFYENIKWLIAFKYFRKKVSSYMFFRVLNASCYNITARDLFMIRLFYEKNWWQDFSDNHTIRLVFEYAFDSCNINSKSIVILRFSLHYSWFIRSKLCLKQSERKLVKKHFSIYKTSLSKNTLVQNYSVTHLIIRL